MIEKERLMTIGQVAQATGVTTHTLRYYQKEDILAPTVRRTFVSLCVANTRGGRPAGTPNKAEWVREQLFPGRRSFQDSPLAPCWPP